MATARKRPHPRSGSIVVNIVTAANVLGTFDLTFANDHVARTFE